MWLEESWHLGRCHLGLATAILLVLLVWLLIQYHCFKTIWQYAADGINCWNYKIELEDFHEQRQH